MPIRTIPVMQTRYSLLSVDKDGIEAPADPDAGGGRLSDVILADLRKDGITDVFVWTHGWKGDLPSAIEQCDSWIGAFCRLDADRKAMAARRPGFKDYHIGFHWPSLAWGDEKPKTGTSYDIVSVATRGVDEMVDHHAAQLGDTPAVRSALQKLFADLENKSAETALTNEARNAYFELDKALGLESDGVPGHSADRNAFDPDQAVTDAEGIPSFGGFFSSLLAPLQQLTFWTMKKRAQTVGENGMHPLLKCIQRIEPALRIHLMGHSFGCIVTSAGLGGPDGNAPLERPIDSCVLVQGAMSLWGFAKTIPEYEGAGYFSHVISDGKVSGPTVVTRSEHDRAVGKLYPWAAGIAGQVAFDLAFGLPKFGAIGFFGICGIDGAVTGDMAADDGKYPFTAGGIYNLNASQYICNGEGASGAHSDIAGPEVAHVIWQAALPLEGHGS